MKLAVLFFGIFFGTLLGIAVIYAAVIAAGKALNRLVAWLASRLKKSESTVILYVGLVLFSAIVAAEFTALIAAGGKK